MSFGCTRTNNTTKRRMRTTELAVEVTMDRAGIPRGELCSLTVGHKREKKKTMVKEVSVSLSSLVPESKRDSKQTLC